jgi:hypothetical protein
VRLWLQGPKYRIVDAVPKWSPSSSTFVLRDDIFVSDGKSTKSYTPAEAQGFGSVVVAGGDENELLRTVDLEPVAWCFRGEVMLRATPMNKWLVARRQSAAGIDCIVLENPSDAYSVWFELKENLPLVRIESRENGKLSWQFDVSTKTDAKYGWVPTGWRFEDIVRGQRIVGSTVATVASFARAEAMEAKLFEIDLPAGVEVYDKFAGSEYVILPNGKTAPFSYKNGRRIVLDAGNK